MQRLQSFLVRGLGALHDLVADKPLFVIVTGIVLAILSVGYAVENLTFLPNFAGLNKEGNSYSRNYESFVKEFRLEPDILVVAKGPMPTENQAFLDRLAVQLSGDSHFQRIYYRIDLKPFKRWAMAYPDLNTLRQILNTVKLAKPVFRAIGYRVDLTQFWNMLPNMQGSQAGAQGDPRQISEIIGLVNLMTGKLEGKSENLSDLDTPFKEISGIGDSQYITLKGGTYALMFARPALGEKGEQDISGAVKAIREAISTLHPQFPNVEPHLTGEPVLGADEIQTAKHDISWAGAISLVLCSTLLILGFGDLRRTLLTVITLFVAIGWSLGYITASVHHLNVFTLSLFPMLIGLAIDFSIQFLGRYREELAKNSSPQEAVRNTFFSTGTGLSAAALITALGFFAISLTQYKGIAELGVATGGSLLLCFISTMTILPAFLIWTERQTIQPNSLKLPSQEFQKGTRVERYLLNHAKVLLLIALAITAFLGMKARSISFDHNVLNLQAKGTDSITTELDLIRVADKSSLFAVLMARNEEKAAEFVNQLRHFDTVGDIQSPLPFIPQDQNKKFPILQEIKKELGDFKLEPATRPVDVEVLASAFAKIRSLIADGRKKLSLASGAFQLLQSFIFPGSQVIPHRSVATDLADRSLALENLERSVIGFIEVLGHTEPQKASEILTGFQSDLTSRLQKGFDLIKNGIPTRPITFKDLPPIVRNQFIGRTGKILIQIYPSQNIWDRPALERFIAQLRQVDPNVTGSPVLILETTRIMLESYKQAAKIAFCVIVGVALVQFRKARLTLFALTPLGVGLIWLMGLMVIFRKSFNPANLLTLPIILGIGVAFGVYVVNRYREEKHPSIFSTSTGRSVLLSALTSIAGFASLLGVSHQGLQSLGFAMTIGLAAITIQALVVLPALLEIIGSYPGVRKLGTLMSLE